MRRPTQRFGATSRIRETDTTDKETDSMPLYEYRCPDCDHRFEVLQRLGAGSDEVTCPQCGRENPSKQLSTFASSSGEGSGASAAAMGGGCGAGGFT